MMKNLLIKIEFFLNSGSVGRSTSRSTGSSHSPGSDSTMKKLTRTLFRRSKSKEKTADLGYKSNVILR